MAFRGAEETLRARILELEQENAALRAEVARLGGEVPLTDPGPAPISIGTSIWSPGDSWLVGWEPESALLAYTGEARDEQYLRFLNLTRKAHVDFALAQNGARQVARFENVIVAPLKDRSLAFFRWPGKVLTSRIALNAALVAQPIQSDTGAILAVTSSRELLVIDPHELVVKERRAVDTQALEQLGFPDGDARQRHNGYELDLELDDGWSLSAFRDVGELRICALSRKFAGNEEMGACVVPRRQTRPKWVREAGGGSFIYLYGLDRMLVIHNVSLEVPPKTWAFWQESGEPVLSITGRGDEAVMEIYDRDASVLSRSSV